MTNANDQVPDGPVPFVLVIFGATGNLARTKLFPALWRLFTGRVLPGSMRIIGVAKATDQGGRGELVRKEIAAAIQEAHSDADGDALRTFLDFLIPVDLDLKTDRAPAYLKEYIKWAAEDMLEQEIPSGSEALDLINARFYCATRPGLYRDVFVHLATGVSRVGWPIAIEKPYGPTAVDINGMVKQLERMRTRPILVDHYNYKQIIEPLLRLRSQPQVKSRWSSDHIAHIQITVAEKDEIGKDPETYDELGALGDMIQSHLLELLCQTMSDLGTSPDLADWRSIDRAGVALLRSIQPDSVQPHATLGQYAGAGSSRETYAALRLLISDDDRWRDVPILLRTGKKMSEKAASISVSFKDGPWIRFWIQPSPTIEVKQASSLPGEVRSAIKEVTESMGKSTNDEDPHETILRELVRAGDLSRPVSRDWAEASWNVIERSVPSDARPHIEEYDGGQDGPPSAVRTASARDLMWLPVGRNDEWP